MKRRVINSILKRIRDALLAVYLGSVVKIILDKSISIEIGIAFISAFILTIILDNITINKESEEAGND